MNEEKEIVSNQTFTVDKAVCSVVFKANFYPPRNAIPSCTKDLYSAIPISEHFYYSAAQLKYIIVYNFKISFCGIIFNDQNSVSLSTFLHKLTGYFTKSVSVVSTSLVLPTWNCLVFSKCMIIAFLNHLPLILCNIQQCYLILKL